MKRIVARTPGGPEQLTIDEAPSPVPGPRDAVVALSASGVNFIDVYFRKGLYKADMPIAIGSEGAGVVTRVGTEVREVAPGDRVAFAMFRGSYAEEIAIPAAQLAKLPDGVSFETAAAVMLQGMTAHYLTRSTFPLAQGQTCLVHAAAGGAGGMLVQMAKQLGARVFGTTSTEAKARDVRALGADDVILYTEQDFEAEVKRLTDGRGVDVVYDSVGQATFDKSLKVLRPRGLLALFGQSSGPVAPLDPTLLNARGSLFLTRPSLAHYIGTRDELLWRANDVLSAVSSGQLQARIMRTYPLERAADAHRDLESRKTTGKLVLTIRDASET
jgi:NADPH2:quinone reductase